MNPTQVDVPLDEIRALAGNAEVTHAPGFTTDGTGDAAALRAEAVALAAAAETAVVFLGLAAHQESEGFDREDIELPREQLELLAEVVRVQPRTAVVLSHGGVLRLAPVAAAPALLDGALLGQAHAAALSPTYCSAGSTRPAASPRPSRSGSRTPPPTWTSRASTATSPTARVCSSATAGTTPGTSRSPSRSATGSPTPSSPTATWS